MQGFHLNRLIKLNPILTLSIDWSIYLGSSVKQAVKFLDRKSREKHNLHDLQPIHMINKSNKQLKGGIETMGFNPTTPAYSGDGIAIWNATDKNGKPFLKVKVLGGSCINCFKVEPKKEE